jgi:phenylacetate-CoA ligase
MKDRIYSLMPHAFQNGLITIFNLLSYRVRYQGFYQFYREEFKKKQSISLEELKEIQREKYNAFLTHVISKSSYYRENFKHIENANLLVNIKNLPIVNKEKIRKNIEAIYTEISDDLIISKTGGTTGKSLEVHFTKKDMQERFAMLDNFRASFGYELGKRTAWFSGKKILTDSDLKINRFWKTDWFYKVRYYSTFHIKSDNLGYYIDDLIKFKPEYFVGFPSTIYEIAKYGMVHDIEFPAGIKGIFPTAETITLESRGVIEAYFKTKIYNQYASSEGAPFIFECKKGNLHLELQSGVFEVLDNNNNDAKIGRLVCTSFTTHGTPLIRYDIGDSIALSDHMCNCGNNNPTVENIMGRIDDYVYSTDNGKINLGNISNTLKDVHGVKRMQVIQDKIEEITILCVVDHAVFTQQQEIRFIQNWRDRTGASMKITIEKVKEIPFEKSGKYRMVKNNIRHLIDV